MIRTDLTDAELRGVFAARGTGYAWEAIQQAPEHIIGHWLEQRAIDLGLRPGKKSKPRGPKQATPEALAAHDTAARIKKASSFCLRKSFLQIHRRCKHELPRSRVRPLGTSWTSRV